MTTPTERLSTGDGVLRLPGRLHRDQQGTISILAVFTVLLFTMLLGMVMNVGRHVDGKIRMQNAADAAAYSGSAVIARGMNSLAFSNHLLCDVFALTAFMREAGQRNAEKNVPIVLAAWNKAGQVLTTSGFPKFVQLGRAIQQKVIQEQTLATAFGEWVAAASGQVLPLMEEILSQQLIPDFQRAVVNAIPDLAQRAAMDVALQHGQPAHGRGAMAGVLWRTSAKLVGGENEAADRTLPAVDPNDPSIADYANYLNMARHQRRQLAYHYLEDWNSEALAGFGYFHPASSYNTGWMSQFGTGWRSFTCGYLNQLLSVEYPESNLPHVIRADVPQVAFRRPCDCQVPDGNAYLERNFTFLGVAYWAELPSIFPKLFRNPTGSDAMAYAGARVFVPKPRLEWVWWEPGFQFALGGAPGDFCQPLTSLDGHPQDPGSQAAGRWIVARQGVPTDWDLLNQHWRTQLVPAAQSNLATILQTTPAWFGGGAGPFRLPNLGGLSSDDIGRISPH